MHTGPRKRSALCGRQGSLLRCCFVKASEQGLEAGNHSDSLEHGTQRAKSTKALRLAELDAFEKAEHDCIQLNVAGFLGPWTVLGVAFILLFMYGKEYDI